MKLNKRISILLQLSSIPVYDDTIAAVVNCALADVRRTLVDMRDVGIVAQTKPHFWTHKRTRPCETKSLCEA